MEKTANNINIGYKIKNLSMSSVSSKKGTYGNSHSKNPLIETLCAQRIIPSKLISLHLHLILLYVLSKIPEKNLWYEKKINMITINLLKKC
ncbi:hypothetical protein BpHYR1_042861 [Brachionus plicatilis]|uniref:Uncharacterized protein n=1 Tax=Brachionus plicatilis TaxID=10195 RepID=A0A3M7PUR2_BRAPC|nr:hypothetical protein BpHYR1_042861 [Brachionus plicatilis]